MDLYNENEHVISSDEYSDDDNDETLFNDAIRSQQRNIISNEHQNKQPKWRIDQKQKELSSLIRRNKISVIYKNKSIKWLNNKRHRERYKEYIYLHTKNVQKTAAVDSFQEEQKNLNKSMDNKYDTLLIQDVVCLSDDNKDFTTKICKDIAVAKDVLTNSSHTFKYNVNYQQENDVQIAGEKNSVIEEKNIEQVNELKPQREKITENPGKRARSRSPSFITESNEKIPENDDKKNECLYFYKSLNDMFPKFDKIATTYVDTIAYSTLRAMDEKLKCLSNEIETLQEILETKEMEWKRLLHLKMVKEDIHSRLIQKKHILQAKEIYTKPENSLMDLKELEDYLSERKQMPSGTDFPTVTIQKLIENRANMSAEDLEREKNNTSRLHSILVSRNMLHGVGNNSSISNGESFKSKEYINNLEGANLSNKGRQGEFKNVKSIISDFRQKNPEILPRVGKRIKSSESSTHYHNTSFPNFEKSSLKQYFNKLHESELYPPQNSVEAISISPVGCVKNVSSNHDIDFFTTVNNNYRVRLQENYIKGHIKDVDEKCHTNIIYPLCQECKCNESRFVCAGCGNQWYCSKKCQISAWDKHSELCTE